MRRCWLADRRATADQPLILPVGHTSPAAAGLLDFQPKQVEQPADVAAVLGCVAEHRRIAIDHVAVAASVALSFDVASFDEIGQDSLRGAERDPDLVGDIAQANLGIASDTQQDLRVIGDELPALAGLLA